MPNTYLCITSILPKLVSSSYLSAGGLPHDPAKRDKLVQSPQILELFHAKSSTPQFQLMLRGHCHSNFC